MNRVAAAFAATTSLLVLAAGPAKCDPAAGAPTTDATKVDATTGATSSKKDVSTLLFTTPQWSKVPARSVITYSYSRKATKSEYGASFDDVLKIKMDKGDRPDARTVEMIFLTGEHRKPAGPFPSDSQNPVLLVVLENNVQELSKLFHANPRYLKNAIRKAWREKAKIEDTTVTVDGKSVPGTRISVTPFVGDAEADRMKGLEDMEYVVETSDSVPGNIATIDIHAPATGTKSFSEVLRYETIKTP